jgi:hypothetical protein
VSKEFLAGGMNAAFSVRRTVQLEAIFFLFIITDAALPMTLLFFQHGLFG